MKLRRPSPSLVISIIALTVACTGTAIAATIITSTTQIKNGVVTSSDVKDGSLQNMDLKKSTITESRLSPGVVKKLDKAPAATGTQSVFEIIRAAGPESQPANVLAKVVTLTVPAGAYSITAKTVMTALVGPQNPIEALVQANGSLGGRCRLDAAGVADESLQNIVITGRQTPATFYMQLTRTVGAPSDITLECTGAIQFRLSATSIIATKVSAIDLKVAT